VLKHSWVLAAVLLVGACALRVAFHSGFVLCDDSIEYTTVRLILGGHSDFKGFFETRFFAWVMNYLVQSTLGTNETTFFLTSWVVSGSFAPLAFVMLKLAGTCNWSAFWGALFVASAPFEVLIGTVRANDLFLAWFLGVGLVAFIGLVGSPRRQAVAVAVLAWASFYVKAWGAYVYVPLILYFGMRCIQRRDGGALSRFVACSMLLHVSAAALWWQRTGVWFPLLRQLTLTSRIPSRDLPQTFLVFPTMILTGSEFGTTLFGIVPHLFFGLLLLKVVGARRWATMRFRFVDGVVLVWLVTFFVTVNFLPNSYRTDGFYLVPRIFRYLAPVSFPLAILTAKWVGDLLVTTGARRAVRSAIWLALLGVNLAQTAEAHAPGKDRQRVIVSAVAAVARRCPPVVVVESWNAYFFDQVYLVDRCPDTLVVSSLRAFSAEEYEKWLASYTGRLPTGTLLVSGVASCVHYGCQGCGFRLGHFTRPLSSEWEMLKELPGSQYIARDETPAVWRLAGSSRMDRDAFERLADDAFSMWNTRGGVPPGGSAPLGCVGKALDRWIRALHASCTADVAR
jgi:hypothetical protein